MHTTPLQSCTSSYACSSSSSSEPPVSPDPNVQTEENWFQGSCRFDQIDLEGYGAIHVDKFNFFNEGKNSCIEVRDRNDFSVKSTINGYPYCDGTDLTYSDDKVVIGYTSFGLGAYTSIWNLADGSILVNVKSTRNMTIDNDTLAVKQYHYEGDTFLSHWHLWDIYSGQELCQLENSTQDDVSSTDPVFDGDMIMIGQRNGLIKHWNRFTGAFVKQTGFTEEGYENRVDSLHVVGDRIVTTHVQGKVNIWDKNTDNLIQSFHRGIASASRVIIDGDLLISNTGDHVSVCNLGEGEHLYTLDVEGGCTIDGDRIIAATKSNGIQVFNKFDGTHLLTLDIDPTDTKVRFIIDKDRLISHGLKGDVIVWNKNNGSLLYTLPEKCGYNLVLDGDRLLSGCNRKLNVWDFSSQATV